MSSADTGTTDAAPVEDEATETDERRQALLSELTEHLGDAVLGSHIAPGRQLWIRVDAGAWHATFRHLRDDQGFRFFDFLSAIDWMPAPYGRYEDATVDLANGPAVPGPSDAASGYATGVAGGETRFQVFARVARLTDGDLGVIVKVDVPPAGDDPDQPGSVDSIADLYAGADWHEREAHEMFGIGFSGHRYLEHIYLPTGFEGHPLRKDFPLLARTVKPWPGIVDVEPMPGGADDDEGEDS